MPLTFSPAERGNDYLRAMEAGTSAGLGARGLDIREETAADRLRMAYDQLAAKEDMAAQMAAAKQQMAHEQLMGKTALAQAAMDLRSQQNDALNQSRADTLALRQSQGQAALDLREKALQNKLSTTPEELVTKTDAAGNLFQNRGGKWWHIPTQKEPMDTITETIPGVPGKKAEEASAGIPLLGWGAHPAVPGTPDIPEMKRTRHIPSSLSNAAAALQSQSPAASVSGNDDVKSQALAAIKAGADADAVRARYKKLTGQDLE